MTALSEFADEIVALEQLRSSNGLAEYDGLQKAFKRLMFQVEYRDKVNDAIPGELWGKFEADM